MMWTLALAVLALSSAHAAEDCGSIPSILKHTPSGEVVEGSVAWADGRLVDAAPEGCPVYTFPDGSQLTAGFVATNTQVGLVEISLEPSTKTGQLVEGRDMSPHASVIDGFNPRSSIVPITRLGGITSAVISPQGGGIRGTSGWVTLKTDTRQAVAVDPQAALEVHPDELGGPASAMALLRELFHESARVARAYGGNTLLSRSDLIASPGTYLAVEAVRRREMPLTVHADRADILEGFVSLSKELGIRMIIVGAAEGWVVADMLADADVGVVIDPMVYGPGSFRQLQAREDNGALLAAAGVAVAIGAEDTHNARSLRFYAGNAVRGGMSKAHALAAITAVPAALYGQDDRGVLADGAMADLAVWSGDPLEISTRLLWLSIDGQPQPLASRQRDLVEAWRELPRVLQPATK